MINVIGGTLYQWGIDRQIEVLNPEIKTVAFANNHHCNCDRIEVVDGIVTIPNKFFQSYQDIKVYGIDAEGNEIYSRILSVNPKLKPSDYSVEIEGGGCDWNAMQNKPFGEETKDVEVVMFQSDSYPLSTQSAKLDWTGIERGDSLIVELNGDTYSATVEYEGNPVYSNYIAFESGCPLMYDFGNNLSSNTSKMYDAVKIYAIKKQTIVTKLDTKFAPLGCTGAQAPGNYDGGGREVTVIPSFQSIDTMTDADGFAKYTFSEKKGFYYLDHAFLSGGNVDGGHLEIKNCTGKRGDVTGISNGCLEVTVVAKDYSGNVLANTRVSNFCILTLLIKENR